MPRDWQPPTAPPAVGVVQEPPAQRDPLAGDPDEQQYSGQYKDGQRHGKGRMKFKYGTYEGDWAHDKMHGFGILHLKTGNIYEGNFADNKFEGWGKLRWKNGKVYEGQLRAGQMCGKGKLTSEEGIYEGEFYDNEMSGKGTMKFSNGDVYTGDWRAGMMWGNGDLSYPDGTVFEGAFYKNQKHGKITRTDGKGNEFSERYHRDELQVSVKVKSKPSKAGKAVGKFIDRVGSALGTAPERLEDTTSPIDNGLDDEFQNDGPPNTGPLFDRPEQSQADVERELDRRAQRKAAGAAASSAETIPDARRIGTGTNKVMVAVAAREGSGVKKAAQMWQTEDVDDGQQGLGAKGDSFSNLGRGGWGTTSPKPGDPKSPGTVAFDEFFESERRTATGGAGGGGGGAAADAAATRSPSAFALDGHQAPSALRPQPSTGAAPAASSQQSALRQQVGPAPSEPPPLPPGPPPPTDHFTTLQARVPKR